MSGKYDTDGPFNDPVVRCCDCAKVVFREDVHKMGGCPFCGNRRIRNVLAMSQLEMDSLRTKNVDPEFLSLFEGKDEPISCQ